MDRTSFVVVLCQLGKGKYDRNSACHGFRGSYTSVSKRRPFGDTKNVPESTSHSKRGIHETGAYPYLIGVYHITDPLRHAHPVIVYAMLTHSAPIRLPRLAHVKICSRI